MFRHGRMLVRPREVKAVRGALTRAKLLDQGIGCPAIFGDPALLYADHVKVPRVLSGRIGIVPHFADQQLPEVKAVVEKHGFHLIDILGDIDDVVRSISGCDWVASSSLHGLVIADAYGVPNVWVKLSDNVMGGSFKFHDYFSGVGRAETGPVRVGPDTTLHELEDQVFSGRIEFDRDTLLAACPFLAGSGGDVKDPVSGGGFR
jgi:pyruvyltransferase